MSPPELARAEASPSTLVAEAERQLNICNSCRYCEGYCAVYPALERRTVLEPGDIAFLANLCHDCRACYYACMYAPPHEFAVNPPAILSALRRETYDAALAPDRVRQLVAVGRSTRLIGRVILIAVSAALLLVLVESTRGLAHLVATGSARDETVVGGWRSPYSVISYAELVSLFSVLAIGSLGAVGIGLARYWRATYGRLRDLVNVRAWGHALSYAATLGYLGGGGEGCYTRAGHASKERRVLHLLVSYGFVLCLAATISGAIEQDLVGLEPPFRIWSVPVVLGLTGGIALVVGAVGLLFLKRRTDPEPSDAAMRPRDVGLLWALIALGATGLLTLVCRSTRWFAPLFALHLEVIAVCFVLVPVTKFVHLFYRLLALVQDDLEAQRADDPAH